MLTILLFLVSTAFADQEISGKIEISPQLQPHVKQSDVLFIVGRHQQMGPPTAVKRIQNPKFPLTFTLGPQDSMMPGAPSFERGRPMVIAVRISRSGNAKPSAGDLEGVYKNNPAKPGDGKVDILIDRVRDR